MERSFNWDVRAFPPVIPYAALLSRRVSHLATPRAYSRSGKRGQGQSRGHLSQELRAATAHSFRAFYDGDYPRVREAQTRPSELEVATAQYSGDARDAQKSISISIAVNGFLHIPLNQHDTPLHIAAAPSGTLEPGPIDDGEGSRVTYPILSLRGFDLLFLYPRRSSGSGDLMLRRYHTRTRKWVRVHDSLIDGEGERNAYWQMAVDSKGTIHLSWVWRETPDVATNHDLCYAKSDDGGKTWRKSSGEKYRLPITAGTAEYAFGIRSGAN